LAHRSVLQCVAVCCRVLQYVAVCGRELKTLQFLSASSTTLPHSSATLFRSLSATTHCNTHCNTLQHTATIHDCVYEFEGAQYLKRALFDAHVHNTQAQFDVWTPQKKNHKKICSYILTFTHSYIYKHRSMSHCRYLIWVLCYVPYMGLTLIYSQTPLNVLTQKKSVYIQMYPNIHTLTW